MMIKKSVNRTAGIDDSMCHDMLFNAPVGIFLSVPEGRLEYANLTLSKMFGYTSPNEMIDTVSDIGEQLYVDIEDRKKLISLLNNNEELLDFESRFQRKNGSVFWASIDVRTVRDKKGNIVNYQGFLSDISERKQEHDFLQKTQFAIERARDSILWIDDDGYVVYANESACASMGYTREEMLALTVFDIDPDFPRENWEQHKLDVRSVGSMSFESRHLAKDGRIFPVEVSTNHFKFNDKYLACAFDRDITERKRVEEALKKSEERFRALFMNAPIPLIHISLDGTIIAINEKLGDFIGQKLGYTIEDVPDLHHWWNLAYPDPVYREHVRSKWIDAVSRAVANNTTVEAGEYCVTCKDGTVLTLIMEANVIGEAIIVSWFDITELREKTAALQESMELLNAAFNATTDGIIVVDKDMNVTQANDQFYEMWRIPSELQQSNEDKELRAFVQDQMVDPDGLNAMVQRLYNSQLQGRREIEFRDGRIFDCYTTPIMMNDMEIARLWDFRDITERKRYEEAIDFERRQLLSVFNSLDELIYVSDPVTYEMLYTNQCLRNTLGKNPIGKLCYQELQGFDKPCEFCTNDIILHNDGQPYRWEYHNPSLNMDFSIIDQLIRWPDGRDVRLEIAVDVTELKHAEAEREKLQAQLHQSQKLEAVGVLAGGVAHDYNNMLSVIMGYSELTIAEMSADNPLRENVEIIYDTAIRSADITRQLLAFARKQTIEPAVFDINTSIEAIMKMIRRLIGENIELEWLPGEGVFSVKMDPSQFDQILVNLCVNARDAIHDIGRITIETDIAYFDDEYCRYNAEFVPGTYVLIAVSDDGCGMDRATIERIFEPFFSTKGIGKGTGMGLATVYGIVRQNDGFINVYSEPGNGTTFKIYIPLFDTEELMAAPEKTEETPLSRGETILIVEDDTVLLGLSEKMLRQLGYNVITADSPGKALRIVRRHALPIHLVITDVVMPEMNGRELALKLREIRPEMKQLFMSGYTADVIAHKGILEKGVYFIQKPFSLKKMADKIRDVLG